MEIQPNSYAEFLKMWGGLAGVVSLLVSVFLLVRALYLDRPHLWFIRKNDETEQSFVRTHLSNPPGMVFGTLTLIISNNSARPNAVIAWKAITNTKYGNVHQIEMLQSTVGDLPPLNVTPIVVPAFSSVEAHLLFLVDVSALPNPVIFDVIATDRSRRVYQISASIPNVVRDTVS
jgi:hypothetical protein